MKSEARSVISCAATSLAEPVDNSSKMFSVMKAFAEKVNPNFKKKEIKLSPAEIKR